MLIKKLFKSLDFFIVIISIVLFTIGVIALYSANGGIDGDFSETLKQVVWFGIGFVCMSILIFIDYDIIGKLWPFIYAITTILLIAVLFTNPINGATSWFNLGGVSLQPSEFAKISLILGLRKDNRIF